MKKELKIVKDYFNLFALLFLVTTIGLYVYLIVEVMPEVIEAFNYLFNINVEIQKEITGFDVIYHSKAIFYLIMFIFLISYSLYGIIELFRRKNERRVFKIMFRSIFYTAGMIMIFNIFAFIYFLFMPVTDLISIACVFFMIFSIVVAVTGRLVSNYTLLTTSLRNRKKLGLFVISSFILLCVLSFTVMDGEYALESCIFYGFEIVLGLLAFPICILFNDPEVNNFEVEPKVIKEKLDLIFDIPQDIDDIKNHQFSKNTKLTRVTIPNTVKEIHLGAFSNCVNIRDLYIPKSVDTIEGNAFFNCKRLEYIFYEGTKDDFNKIELKNNWLKKSKTSLVYCSDGVVYIHK